jgi:hypothetical protein
MSQATRCVALQNAVAIAAHTKTSDVAAVLAIAEQMHTFLNSDEVQQIVPAGTPAAAPKPAAPAPVAAPKNPVGRPPKAKPAKTEEQLVAEATAAAAAEAEADDSPVATKEDAGKALNALLSANLRAQAVALLKKFGAASLSLIPADKYGEFVAEANALLPSEGELTD